MYFLNERYFSLFVFEVDFALKIEDNVCFLFLEFKLNTKEGTANEKTHLFIFIKFIKKNKRKKTVKQHMKKNE